MIGILVSGRSYVVNKYKEMVSSGHLRGIAYINSQQLGQHAQDLCKATPDGDESWAWNTTPLATELSVIVSY